MTVVDLCTSSGHALYFYQVLWNYLERYQSYRADTISIPKISKGNNSAKNVGGVTVFNLCTSSDRALHLCQVSWNYLERYQSYGADTNDQPLTDWRTDGRTDTQKFGGYNIIPRHFLWGGGGIKIVYCDMISHNSTATTYPSSTDHLTLG